MSINFNASPSPYFQTPDFGQVSDSATRGRTQEINAGYLGQGKLLEAVDMAKMLEKTAGVAGAATRYDGSQLGTASEVGGIAEGLGTLAFGAFKGGHLGGGPEGAPPSGEGGSDTDVRSWLTPNVP